MKALVTGSEGFIGKNVRPKCSKIDKDIRTETFGFCGKELDHSGPCFIIKRVRVDI